MNFNFNYNYFRVNHIDLSQGGTSHAVQGLPDKQDKLLARIRRPLL